MSQPGCAPAHLLLHARQGRGLNRVGSVLSAQQGLAPHLESRLVKAGEGLMCAPSLKLCRCQGLGRAILRCMAGSTACRRSGAIASKKHTNKSTTACRHSPEGDPVLPHCLPAWPVSRPESTACRLSGVTASMQCWPTSQTHHSSRRCQRACCKHTSSGGWPE